MLTRLFRLAEHGTTARTEILGGVTTFATMAYIIVVNPAILAFAGFPTGPATVAVPDIVGETEADALAAQLQESYQIKPGDRVALAMRNNPEWVIAYVAMTLAGAIVVPINSWGKTEELAYAVTDSSSRLLICDTGRYKLIADADGGNTRMLTFDQESNWYPGNTHIHYDEKENRPDDRMAIDCSVEGYSITCLSVLDRRVAVELAVGRVPQMLRRRAALAVVGELQKRYDVPVVVNMSFGIASVEEGDDAMGDTDGDGTCDACTGNPASGDADGDGDGIGLTIGEGRDLTPDEVVVQMRRET